MRASFWRIVVLCSSLGSRVTLQYVVLQLLYNLGFYQLLMCKPRGTMVKRRAADRNSSPAVSSIPGRSIFFFIFFSLIFLSFLNVRISHQMASMSILKFKFNKERQIQITIKQSDFKNFLNTKLLGNFFFQLQSKKIKFSEQFSVRKKKIPALQYCQRSNESVCSTVQCPNPKHQST